MNALVIARNTVGDALRKRVLLVFLLIAIVMLFLSLFLAYFSARERMVIFKSVAFVILLVFGGLISITTAIFLIPNEVEKRTIYSVLSKPVQRWEFFIGKFLGGAFTVLVTLGLMAIVLAVVTFMMSAQPPSGAETMTSVTQQVQKLGLVFRGTAVIYFELVLLTAIATTLSLFLTPTVNFAVTALLFIVGSFQDVLAAWTRRPEYVIAKWVATAFYYVTPHFQDFNIMGSLVHPEVELKSSPVLYAIQVCAYGVVYAMVLLLAGVLVFDRKEV
jgi:ABC-type transport system involved in multi-copper enzyme maturation permease subunit